MEGTIWVIVIDYHLLQDTSSLQGEHNSPFHHSWYQIANWPDSQHPFYIQTWTPQH